MEEEKNEIKEIRYPNTVSSDMQNVYSVSSGCSFEKFNKNGEMASIGWIKVIKNNKKVSEIKESVCDIYFTE